MPWGKGAIIWIIDEVVTSRRNIQRVCGAGGDHGIDQIAFDRLNQILRLSGPVKDAEPSASAVFGVCRSSTDAWTKFVFTAVGRWSAGTGSLFLNRTER